jgi:HEAT repeat protein
VREVRVAAVEALGGLKDTLAVRALIETLKKDTEATVRRAAAWALGQLDDARAIPALTDALRADPDVEVRRNAAEALGEIEDARRCRRSLRRFVGTRRSRSGSRSSRR